MSDDIKELSEELDLEQWFDSEGVAYKMTQGSSGMQINVQECPDSTCGDSRYRVYLNAETGVGNCFICNARFSKLGFIHTHLHGDPKASKWAETFRHVKQHLADQGWRPKRKTPVAITTGAVKLPDSFPLPTPDGQNLTYLEGRGIDAEMAAYFHLRYCDSGWWNFTKEDGSKGGQKFEQRLIIPVFDLDGELVTFQGRDVLGNADPKYLFPKGLPGTGRFLYNGQNAVRSKRVAMGEGAFDVFGLKLALDADPALRDITPVGSFGKHLSYGDANGRDQIGCFLTLRKHGLEEVIIVWDGTPDALAAALKAAEQLRKISLRVKIALMPLDTDPNECDGAITRQAIYGATPYSAQLAVKWRLQNPYTQARRELARDSAAKRIQLAA
ncbi:DNA primase [Methylobacterium sp. WL103]|uniref:DNA primase n=1 Tax=Methylobacterium sp. WL103 TaxID=2603891 RepID=UPI0011C7489C|nr:DNA primase [Methylobacterium sp. WL103]TXN07934.1 DNA primase [Methylobacterium sp. WL103]